VGGLRSSVPVEKRERWIREKGPRYDVIVSYPKLVETGLDLFDKRGSFNFATIIWYETGYNLFTMRQASARAWRIGQRHECRVYYLYYEATMQENAMQLMGVKMAAAQALEGKFSTEGLVAMGGDDTTVEMALAKSIDSVLKGDGARAWEMIGDVQTGPVLPRVLSGEEIDGDLDEIDRMLADDDADDGDDFDDLAELDRLMDQLDREIG
jgi:hypothetical protein